MKQNDWIACGIAAAALVPCPHCLRRFGRTQLSFWIAAVATALEDRRSTERGSLSRLLACKAAFLHIPAYNQYNSSKSRIRRTMEPIAICGMSMRLPGDVRDAHSFWEALVQKKDLKSRVPADRFNIDSFYSSYGKPGTVTNREAFYLANESLGHFDEAFFRVGNEELRNIDPQQRMVLELTHECLENAGEVNFRGKRIGCYVGTFGDDWIDLGAKETLDPSMYQTSGRADFAISNRASYEFDFRGPSMTIKSGCSAAMLCLNEACLAIDSGQCESAIVAGTNMILTPTVTINMGNAVLSPTGSCKTFDAAADGYARGEAINAIFVKGLSDAVRDGNAIRAVIRGVGINADGQTSSELTPSRICQEVLIRDTYSRAGLSFADTGLFECHGTGTRVGDPIEANVVSKLFGDHGIHIGAVKPNFGHSEGASALTSIIKAVLCLEKKVIPPNMRFKTPNPNIQFGDGRMIVPVKETPWPEGKKERVSVNSFGIGGANGHVIIDSAASWASERPAARETRPAEAPRLLVLSAHLESSLAQLKDMYRTLLLQSSVDIQDLAYTLGSRRHHLKYRSFCVTDVHNKGPQFTPTVSATEPTKIFFVFSGQGTSWPQMGVELLDQNEPFSELMQRLDGVLAKLPECTFSLREELMRDAAHSRLHEAEISQPVITAIQMCLCLALGKAGILPSAVVGHSSGEIAAAYAAGALTEEEAISTAFYRGQAIKSDQSSGAMVNIGLERHIVERLPLHGASLACDNSPSNVTLSGSRAQVEAAVDSIEDSHPDCLVKMLPVNKAYHSDHMHPASGSYEAMLQGKIKAKHPTIPYYSGLFGRETHKTETLGPDYWSKHLESPVLFREAVHSIISSVDSGLTICEIGPHPTLAGSLLQCCAERKTQMHYVSFMRKSRNSAEALLNGVGQLYQLRHYIDFRSLTTGGKTLTDLPNYPWQHNKQHWNETRLTREWRFRKYSHHDLLGSKTLESSATEPSWRNILRLDNVPWIKDHQVGSEIVLPFAAFGAMAGEAVHQLDGKSGAFVARHLVVSSALVMHERDAVEIITSLKPARLTDSLDSAWYDFTIASYQGTQWVRHCKGLVKPARSNLPLLEMLPSSSDLPRKVDKKFWYKDMARVGLKYGIEFQRLQDISAGVNDHKASATIKTYSNVAEPSYPFHPSCIDGALQLIGVAASLGLSRNVNFQMVPTRVEELYVNTVTEDVTMTAEVEVGTRATLSGDVTGVSGAELVFHVKGLRLIPLEDLRHERGPDPHAAAELVWAPDVELLDMASLPFKSGSNNKEMQLAETLAFLCALETRDGIKGAECSYSPQYLNWLHEWTKSPNVKQQGLARLPRPDRLSLVEAVARELSNTSAAPVCKAIMETLQMGEESCSYPLNSKAAQEILFWTTRSSAKFDAVALLAHNNPLLTILELRDERSSTSASVLQTLTTSGGDRLYSTYTIADTPGSPTEEHAKDVRGVEYTIIDIFEDLTSQGFSAASYDLILTGDDLFRNSTPDDALANIRKLLRPSGRLIISGHGSEFGWPTYAFGRRETWWHRQYPHSPPADSLQDLQKCKDWLCRTGFADVSIVEYETTFTLIAINSSPRNTNTPVLESIDLLCAAKDDSLVQRIRSIFSKKGLSVENILTLSDISTVSVQGRDIVSVIDVQGPPVLERITAKNFALLKGLLQSSTKSILWLTAPSQTACPNPNYGSFLGLARTARTELGTPICTLELDRADEGADQAIWSVFSKFSAQLQRSADEAVGPDFEYAFFKGKVHTPRFYRVHLNERLLLDSSIGDDIARRPHRLQITTPGRMDTLQWVPVSNYRKLLPNYIEVQVKAVGVNFKDVLISAGVIDNTGEGLGVEGSGVVTQVGSHVNSFRPGDRVMFCGPEGYADYLRGPEHLACHIPEGIGFDEAATVPCVYLTALYGLLELGRLRKGESVLIHSGCGGVGLAAIQVSRMVGAEIFVTVGSELKVQHLTQTYGIPRNHIFTSRSVEFYSHVMRETKGRGVDVVLNSLSGELLHASWQCVARFGRMIDIGKRDFLEFGKLEMKPFEGNRTYCGLSLAEICEEKEDVARRLFSQLFELLDKRLVKPITPITKFSAEAVEECFRYMQKGQHIGKIVVEMPDDVGKLCTARQKRILRLDPEASYLLVGGLGGLGTSIARWLVENGAKNLVFLSRAAGKSQTHLDILDELCAMGCVTTALAGDVTDEAKVKDAVAAISPPVKGVIQASAVLKDQSIVDMSIDDWTAAINPKVQGTWNIHNSLRHSDLDFFVVLSSLSGIVGNHGQANYNAANMFLDAFVNYRHSSHLAASVLDIGPVSDIGLLHERQDLVDLMQTSGAHMLREQDILDAMHWAIDNSKPWEKQHESKSSPLLNVNRGGMVLGLRSTIPLQDSGNNLPWNRDRRMAVYHNCEYDASGIERPSDSNKSNANASQRLLSALAKIHATPAEALSDPATARILAEEIGRKILSMLLKPEQEVVDVKTPLVDMGLDSLTGMEMKRWWRDVFRTEVNVLQVASASTLEGLGQLAVDGLRHKLLK